MELTTELLEAITSAPQRKIDELFLASTVKGVVLCKNNSSLETDKYARVGVVINKKIHWLDYNDFYIEEIKGAINALGVGMDTKQLTWGIFSGIIAKTCYHIQVLGFNENEQDAEQLVTGTNRSVSQPMSDKYFYWDLCCLMEEYDIESEEGV